LRPIALLWDLKEDSPAYVSQRSIIQHSQPRAKPSQSDIPDSYVNSHFTSWPTTPRTAVLPQPCYTQPTSPRLRGQSCACRVPGPRHGNTSMAAAIRAARSTQSPPWRPVASHRIASPRRRAQGKRLLSSHNNKRSIIVPPSECCTHTCMRSARGAAQSQAAWASLAKRGVLSIGVRRPLFGRRPGATATGVVGRLLCTQ
jgi:hypothetical protein